MGTTILIKKIDHKNREWFGLYFEKDFKISGIIRKINGYAWTQTHQCWLVPYLKKNQEELILRMNDLGELKFDSGIQFPELQDQEKEKIRKFTYWMKSKRYSESTIETYSEALQVFLLHFSGKKEIAEITNEDLIIFNNEFILKKGLSASYQNQVVNAVKLFFRTIEEKKLEPELIHRPKTPKLLPNVLSKEEVKRILCSSLNIKHRAMLSLIYSCGLRCGEMIRLKKTDIDSSRKLVIIRQSKGRKDRVVPLSEKILLLLREYYIIYKPEEYLFEGMRKREPYSDRSLQLVLKQSLGRAGVKKPVTLHWLRHSYATHLLESGTDLRYIQELLGHGSSRTTEIYTHVSTKNIQQIRSPFDDL